jgi:hypothetical protein
MNAVRVRGRRRVRTWAQLFGPCGYAALWRASLTPECFFLLQEECMRAAFWQRARMADETGENRLKIAEARARVMAPKTAANTTEAPNQASGRDLLLLEQDGKMHRQKKRIFQMGVGSLALIFALVSQTVATFVIVSTQVRACCRARSPLTPRLEPDYAYRSPPLSPCRR